MKNIFTITTMRNSSPPTHCRCVGWSPNLEDAKNIILSNYGDIYEDSETYAVIEETEPYLYPHTPNLWWFKWCKEDEEYKELDKRPEEFNCICNFGIG